MISKTGKLKNYRIIVTGASGFIGRNLVESLVRNGAFVVGIDIRDLSFKNSEIINCDSFRFINGDFTECAKEVLGMFKSGNNKLDAFFHMAGLSDAGESQKNPSKAFELNVNLTQQTLDFCRKNNIKRFIFPSTGLVYGDYLKRPISEKDSIFPQSVYATTKAEAEEIIMGYAEHYEMICLICRLSNVYGPGCSDNTIIGTIVRQIKNGENIKIRDLTPIRDFIHIDDVTEGFLRLLISLERPGCSVVNLSTSIGTNIKKVVETVGYIMGLENENSIDRISSDCISDMLVLDNTLLSSLTRWKPLKDLATGLSLLLRGTA